MGRAQPAPHPIFPRILCQYVVVTIMQNLITLVGLGPGDPALLTREAWELIGSASEIYLRTRHHPAIAGFPSNIQLHSFDDLYESADTFEAVYEHIVQQVLELGKRPQGVIYAVPGHPYIAEATGPAIARQARQAGIQVRVRRRVELSGAHPQPAGPRPIPAYCTGRRF